MKLKILLTILYLLPGKILAQNVSIPEKLKENIAFLDSTMQVNSWEIVEVLTKDVSFSHSNGWVQNLEDFEKDFKSKKVSYDKIEQLNITEVKEYRNFFVIRRQIEVSGKYKVYDFSMTLALLELWKKQKGTWKLWVRQATELKK
ncbi:DUF4440 domain-containing protein [Flavobacterium sp. NST-5]|uniref:DUF4440 domain-containing protein n=1 Tax=Flavobacterium ichthyis TaxID=2698827 RepID=A0ABW9Z7X8_9FLAO|nr:DUF4440 domain-containing protein [Flavobacterium ichthyis]NBL64968.1 DUF4440 domain-containing protein [Flavobacterium ichthyis]